MRYTCTSNVRFGGKDYAIGDGIELGEDDADTIAELTSCGYISDDTTPVAATQSGSVEPVAAVATPAASDRDALGALKFAELTALAAKEGVAVPPTAKSKAAVIELIVVAREKARAAAEAETPTPSDGAQAS